MSALNLDLTNRDNLPYMYQWIYARMEERKRLEVVAPPVEKKVEKKTSTSNKITVAAAKKAVDHVQFTHQQDDGQITLFQKVNKYNRGLNEFKQVGINQRHYPLRDLTVENIQEYILSKNNDVYISANSFWCPKRSAETLRHINSLYVDIDKHSTNKVSKEEIAELLAHYEQNVWGKLLPHPSLVVSTGRGVQMYWLLENLPKQGLTLWTKVEQALAKRIDENLPVATGFELDWSCTDVTRVLRLAGTNNSKSRTQAKIVYQDDNAVYRLDDLTKDYFRKLYISPKRRQELESNKKLVHNTEKQKREFKLHRLLTTHSLHLARLEDIVKLQELRNAADDNCEGIREFMCFLYRYYSCFAVNDPETVLENTLDFNHNFISPISDEEVIEQTISAEKAYQKWMEQYDLILKNEADGISTKNKNRAGYNYKTETLVKKLRITDVEARQLKTLITSTVKKERNTEAHRVARRNDEGLTAKQQEMKDLKEQSIILQKQGLSIRKIAEELNVKVGRVQRALNSDY